MLVKVISDTHGDLPSPELLSGADVIIHAGDLCPNISYNDKLWDSDFQYQWIKEKFLPWKNQIQSNKFLFVPGNHDTVFEQASYKRQIKLLFENNNINVLIDDAITINGIKFYGTPWIVPVAGWSFCARENSMITLREIIPDDTNILISHTPPYGILDEIEHYGCKALLKRLDTLEKLKYLICGHCHEDGGKFQVFNNIKIINASCNIMSIQI